LIIERGKVYEVEGKVRRPPPAGISQAKPRRHQTSVLPILAEVAERNSGRNSGDLESEKAEIMEETR
jgi:hypothetical protein